MAEKSFLYNFSRIKRPVSLINSESLLPYLDIVLRDWKIKEFDQGSDINSIITLEKTDAGYRRESNWLINPAIFKDPVDTVCDLIVDLIHAYLEDNKGVLCLHTAAVEFGGSLVIFPNTYRSGKSVLSTMLVSLGGRLFTDDVLPISPDDSSGMALGILPRLRMPLPESCGPKFNDFISKRAGPQNNRYLYVNLNEYEQASFGETASVDVITILERNGCAEPTLTKTEKSTVLRDVILRNFARQNPALEIVDQLHSMVEKADCYTLRYSDLDKGAKLLLESFSLPVKKD